MQSDNKYILWLVSWYPNPRSTFEGDFIQRHAYAASTFTPIVLVHVLQYGSDTKVNENKIEVNKTGNLTEIIISFRFLKTGVKFIDKIIYNLRYYSVYKKYIRNYFRKNGLPSLMHVHVPMKAGMLARWIKRKWGIPYLITEHATIYLPGSIDSFLNRSFYYRSSWHKVLKGASGFSVVSKYLGDCIKKIFDDFNFIVIPNVVNTDIFKPAIPKDDSITNFIHISVLNFQKNPEDIIKAFSVVQRTNPNIHLSIVGPYKENLYHLVNELLLESQISFHLEVPQSELVKLVQQSDALILYSRYETFGCVIIEANACGIPVIVSDLKVFKETVTEGENGIFIKGEDPSALAEKLLWFIENKKQFDSAAISTKAHSLYSYERIGKQFSDWYAQVLNQK